MFLIFVMMMLENIIGGILKWDKYCVSDEVIAKSSYDRVIF